MCFCVSVLTLLLDFCRTAYFSAAESPLPRLFTPRRGYAPYLYTSNVNKKKSLCECVLGPGWGADAPSAQASQPSWQPGQATGQPAKQLPEPASAPDPGQGIGAASQRRTTRGSTRGFNTKLAKTPALRELLSRFGIKSLSSAPRTGALNKNLIPNQLRSPRGASV